MVALLVAFAVTVASPILTNRTIICEVGKVAMRDLPNVNGNKKFDAYYAASERDGRDLLTICPKLRTDIPKGYPIANYDAQSRASMHVPVPGQRVREAFIYSVGVPEISSDAKSALVHFSYSCTGLCGGELEARYVRTSKGWQRQGGIKMLAVS